MIMGAVLLEEQIHSIDLLGMALIGAGLLCIDGRVLKLARDRSTNVVAGLRTRLAARQGSCISQ
jgi:hypothetical protein